MAHTEPNGLSSAEAQRRLVIDGANELPCPPRRGAVRIALSVLAEPMFLLLVAAALIYSLIGDLAEGALLGTFAALTVGLVVVQQSRSERAIKALRNLAAPTARVLRDGVERRIAAREVVRDDLLLVGEGERVAADALLQRCEGLAADESLLTGESVPVDKASTMDAGRLATGDELTTMIHAGTLIVRGSGIALVSATGAATRAGRIGLALASLTTQPTPLQRSIQKLVRGFGIAAAIATAAVVVLYSLALGDWLQGVLSGISLAMALLPEEFPMALAVFLALGAWRLAQIKVLSRRTEVVETLGATSVLCLDKTGTLTENRMRVRALSVGADAILLAGGEGQLPDAFHKLVEYAVLASKRRAFDPMDQAIAELAASTVSTAVHADWRLEREYGLSPRLLAFTRIWSDPSGQRVAASKGAPEAIASLCRLTDEQHAILMAEAAKLAADGLRILAVAAGTVATQIPDDPYGLSFRPIGLVGFFDPPRTNAVEAVTAAQRAGIAVAMITGDHPATAQAVARLVGIDTEGGTLTGKAITSMDDAALRNALRHTRIFARILPEQKLRLVQAFKANDEVVAMTGDGVNDAPALKAAHIGIAMGLRGTDVAREAAGIVLLDDDIGHLVDGIRTGRRIFENLRKVLIYIGAIHVPIAGLALLPILLGLPPLFLPVHVVLIEMVIDPICSIAFESAPAERDIMHRRPRHPGAPLAGPAQLGLALVQGLLLLCACLVLYTVCLHFDSSADEARTLAVIALTTGNLMLVRVDTARGATLPSLAEAGHGAFWLIAAITLIVVTACVFTPWLAQLFHFVPPTLTAALLAAASGMFSVLAFDLLKPLRVVQGALGRA